METDFVQCEYPFWWNNLVAALDSVSLVGLTKDDEQVSKAVKWLIDYQEEDGLWRVSYAKPDAAEKDTAKAREKRLWVSLAICRVLKRLL